MILFLVFFYVNWKDRQKRVVVSGFLSPVSQSIKKELHMSLTRQPSYDNVITTQVVFCITFSRKHESTLGSDISLLFCNLLSVTAYTAEVLLVTGEQIDTGERQSTRQLTGRIVQNLVYNIVHCDLLRKQMRWKSGGKDEGKSEGS